MDNIRMGAKKERGGSTKCPSAATDAAAKTGSDTMEGAGNRGKSNRPQTWRRDAKRRVPFAEDLSISRK